MHDDFDRERTAPWWLVVALAVATALVILCNAARAQQRTSSPVLITTVAGLPTCNSYRAARVAGVTDASRSTSCATGGGANKLLCQCDGASTWVAVGSGGSGNSFETINAPAGTDPVADSATDTLNVTCAGGLTCTGDATTDTLDLAMGTAGTATALAANGANCSAGSAAGGVDASGAAESCIDHGGLGGLTDDDHAQYALLAGRAGGQSLSGGTATGNNLWLRPNTFADQGNGRVCFGINGVSTTGFGCLMSLNSSGTGEIQFMDGTGGGSWTGRVSGKAFNAERKVVVDHDRGGVRVVSGDGYFWSSDANNAHDNGPDTGLVRGAAARLKTTNGSSGAGDLEVTGRLLLDEQAVTCTTSGDANPGALTITPAASTVTITNSDPDGCDVTMSETGAVAGEVVEVYVASNGGGTVNFADTAGVTELAGVFNAGIYDSITLRYGASTWRESGRSNN